jgi:hypothetical protein
MVMSYIFYQPVTNEFELIEEMLSWAKERCPSYITNDYLRGPNGDQYRLYFSEEKDYAWFSLRWS